MKEIPAEHSEPWQRPYAAPVRLRTPSTDVAGTGVDRARLISAALTCSHAHTIWPNNASCANSASGLVAVLNRGAGGNAHTASARSTAANPASRNRSSVRLAAAGERLNPADRSVQ